MQEGSRLSRVSAIVFDLDYTLFDASQWHLAALRFGARQRGLNQAAVDRAIDSYVLANERIGHDIYNAVLHSAMQSDSGSNIKSLSDASNRYQGQGEEWELYPGVRETLIELSRRYRLALISDGPVEAQKAKVSALGLAPFFRSIVYSDQIDGVRSRRPDPRPFREMRDLLELPSNQILFVGDHPAQDFSTPRYLGFVTCRVLSGPYRNEPYPDDDSAAEFESTTVARLPELLVAPAFDLSSYLHLPFLKQPEQAAPADLKVTELAEEVIVEPAKTDSEAPRRETPVLLPQPPVRQPSLPSAPAPGPAAKSPQSPAPGSLANRRLGS